MEAYRSIRAEMRDALKNVTDPNGPPGDEPMRRGPDDEDEDEAPPPIDPWVQEAYEALVTACITREPFLLLPCTVNGEPTAAIVHVSHTDQRRRRTHVTPLFVAMTPGMVLIDQKGRRAGTVGERDEDDDGGSEQASAGAPAPS